MYDFHHAILDKILSEDPVVASPIPGEAPSAMSNQPVITEPSNDSSQSETPSIYDLYPELVNVDITSACTLADYFASLCEEEQSAIEAQQQNELVPSLGAINTPDEF